METLTQAINKRFNNQFEFLKLFEVVYDKGLNVCNVTFLFPYDKEELSAEERDSLTAYLREYLALNAKVRLKLKKSFLDDNLVIKEISSFFESEHKGLIPYIFQDNIKVTRDGFDIKIVFGLNQDVLSLLDEKEMTSNLKSFLQRRFIANFDISFEETEETLPEELDYDDLPSAPNPTPRYNVEIIGKFIGEGIAPKPEYIKNVHKPKKAVIFAGIITDITKKSFIRKHGKNKGQEGCFYKFNLFDDNKIECVYFCPKTHQPKMDKLEEGMYMLCVGDVETGLNGGLCYKIKKMAYANKKANEEIEEKVKILPRHKQVVFPEPMTSSSQDNLFEDKAKYNDFIMNNEFVVFDLETTGLSADACEIIELGAVKIKNGKICEKFSSFVKPKESIPEEITKITGITDSMVAFAPSAEDVILDFYEYTRGCIISGYNIVNFDMAFVKKVASNLGIKFDNTIIDAYIVARQSVVRVPNYKLGTIVKALGLVLNDAHRAYNDAHATAQVLMQLNKADKSKQSAGAGA